MNIEQAILETIRTLPPEKQSELLNFANSLKPQAERKRPLQSMKGLCADLGVSLSEEDIAEARQEMWKNFPREA